jgi:hypothetical protein
VVDVGVACVDQAVLVDDDLGELDVVVLERLDGAVQRGEDEADGVKGAPLEVV